MSSRFEYLPGALGIYFAVLIIATCACAWLRFSSRNQYDMKFFLTFKTVYFTSVTSEGILCIYRGTCFCYILAALLANLLVTNKDPYFYQYFTVWNTALILTYYLLSTISSVLSLVYFGSWDPRSTWKSSNYDYLGHTVHVLLETSGSSALFVSAWFYLLISSDAHFSNISLHLITTLTLLADFAFNAMTVRLDHMPYMLVWIALYITFVSGLVASGSVEEWPYFFLQTDASDGIIWYGILAVSQIVFYGIWWVLSLMKNSAVPSLRWYSPVISSTRQRHGDNGGLERDSEQEARIVPYTRFSQYKQMDANESQFSSSCAYITELCC